MSHPDESGGPGRAKLSSFRFISGECVQILHRGMSSPTPTLLWKMSTSERACRGVNNRASVFLEMQMRSQEGCVPNSNHSPERRNKLEGGAFGWMIQLKIG